VGGQGGAGSDNTCGSPQDCDDGVFCNGAEDCVAVGTPGADARGCIAGTPAVCPQDSYTCTTQVCDVVADECRTVVNDVICDDGQFCNGPEHCDPTSSQKNPTTGCVVAAPNSLPCSDGISCTNDKCNEVTDSCDYEAD